jgi:hypothetical protein
MYVRKVEVAKCLNLFSDYIREESNRISPSHSQNQTAELSAASSKLLFCSFAGR